MNSKTARLIRKYSAKFLSIGQRDPNLTVKKFARSLRKEYNKQSHIKKNLTKQQFKEYIND